MAILQQSKAITKEHDAELKVAVGMQSGLRIPTNEFTDYKARIYVGRNSLELCVDTCTEGGFCPGHRARRRLLWVSRSR